jgi:SulP family sulfate permease
MPLEPKESTDKKPGFPRWVQSCVPKFQLPVLKELRNYSRETFRADLAAGATLSFVSIPQAIGFALILGLPPTPVVLSVIVGGFFGSLFFSSHHHVFGPTSSSCLIVATAIASISATQDTSLSPLQLAIYMALIIGVVQLAAGVLHFGEVTKFISRSVVVAYSAAIGLMLVASQLHNLLGLPGGSGTGFIASLRTVFQGILRGQISWFDAAIGLCALLLFPLGERCFPRRPTSLILLLTMALAASGYAYLFTPAADTATGLPFHISQDMGALVASLPDFSTITLFPKHLGLLPALLGSSFAIALLGMLESASITKGFAAQSGQRVDTNQELLGMGAGNIANALFGAVPGSSSFTRSAVIYQTGAKTQCASMFSSIIALLAVLLLAPVFNFIPLAVLAAVLIRIGVKMLIPSQIRVACCSTRSDAAVFALTLSTALFIRLDIAIYAGIGLSLALFLQKTSAPMLVEYSFDNTGSLAQIKDKAQRVIPQIAIIHVEGELFFGAADVFLTQVRHQADDSNIRLFILRLKNARHLDASTVMALESLHESLRKTGRHLLISGCTPDVINVIRNSGVIRTLGQENVFEGDPANPNLSTRKALLRARQVLESDDADIRIFYDRRRKPISPQEQQEAAWMLDFQI